jgi:hypothetical protein
VAPYYSACLILRGVAASHGYLPRPVFAAYVTGTIIMAHGG